MACVITFTLRMLPFHIPTRSYMLAHDFRVSSPFPKRLPSRYGPGALAMTTHIAASEHTFNLHSLYGQAPAQTISPQGSVASMAQAPSHDNLHPGISIRDLPNDTHSCLSHHRVLT